MKIVWTALVAMLLLALALPAAADDNPGMKLLVKNSGGFEAKVVVQDNDASRTSTKALPANGEVDFTRDETSYDPSVPELAGWSVTVVVSPPGQTIDHKCPFDVMYYPSKDKCEVTPSTCRLESLSIQNHCDMVWQINTDKIP